MSNNCKQLMKGALDGALNEFRGIYKAIDDSTYMHSMENENVVNLNFMKPSTNLASEISDKYWTDELVIQSKQRKSVPIRDLISSQDFVYPDIVKEKINATNDLPIGVVTNEGIVIVDGHHRVASEYFKGSSSMDIELIIPKD